MPWTPIRARSVNPGDDGNEAAMSQKGRAQRIAPASDIEIARAARLLPIEEVGARLGIPAEHLYRHGPHKAKIALPFVRSLEGRRQGRLVLVTAINPTPAGEGKTTTTVGLGDGLSLIGKKTAICLREPSLGPCFGVKGGAAGGGFAQIVPMEDINLHFTGDFHAIGAANNLLAAMIDNHVHWGNSLDIDVRRIAWKRAMDMNDRALRQINVGLGGAANGFPREDGFDITVASEVMAIFCLARDMADLERRLGRIVIGQNRAKGEVRASDVGAVGAMTVLLKEAMQPNLVQTLEGTPAFVHGGPFANIAHGCNSVMATRAALSLADFVVTEAGFGADLGAEKFFDIKCRKAGLRPDAVVLVATIRALKMHGGVAREDLGREDLKALDRGIANLERHLENLARFGVPAIVAINRFNADTDAEMALLMERVKLLGSEAVECTHWADGAEGTRLLAEKVARLAEGGHADFRPLYPDDMPLWEKIETIATRIYGAAGASAAPGVRERLAAFEAAGYGNFPVCMAKTQYSFSTDPNARGAPTGHIVPVRDVRLAGGAEFVVALAGEIMTMPGLPRRPAAEAIHLDDEGRVQGLF